jgi:hypothetical protein
MDAMTEYAENSPCFLLSWGWACPSDAKNPRPSSSGGPENYWNKSLGFCVGFGFFCKMFSDG